MSTPLSQKIGIWIIAVVLTIGTLGSFLAMVLSVQNQSIDQAEYQKQYEKMLKDQKSQHKRTQIIQNLFLTNILLQNLMPIV